MNSRVGVAQRSTQVTRDYEETSGGSSPDHPVPSFLDDAEFDVVSLLNNGGDFVMTDGGVNSKDPRYGENGEPYPGAESGEDGQPYTSPESGKYSSEEDLGVSSAQGVFQRGPRRD
ncbi:MAG: hypothetical protein ABEJ03_02490 [Candidatus Nanohaloarchaea archaeon]